MFVTTYVRLAKPGKLVIVFPEMVPVGIPATMLYIYMCDPAAPCIYSIVVLLDIIICSGSVYVMAVSPLSRSVIYCEML